MSQTHEGYLLIADITGYTQYLNESELEHAHETLAALLELLVENTRPPLVISRLAGDAVISYCFRENFSQGQTFVEKIEDTYVTFRKTLERLVLNNTCRCNACANISSLDLKFFIHYGAFAIQHISDHDELVGRDINLVHRLLKNSVPETTGFRAYALYTIEAIRQLNVADLEETLASHSETYEHLGEVKVLVQDMHPIWAEKRGKTIVEFPAERTWGRFEFDLEIPLEPAWDYLISPRFRTILTNSDRMEIANRSHGRIAQGSVYQCYHGDSMAPQTILEWQPFEFMLLREMLHARVPDVYAISEYRLSTIEGGTRLAFRISRPYGPFLQGMLPLLLTPVFARVVKQGLKAFSEAIEKDYRARRSPAESPAEITGEQIEAAAAAGLEEAANSD